MGPILFLKKAIVNTFPPDGTEDVKLHPVHWRAYHLVNSEKLTKKSRFQ